MLPRYDYTPFGVAIYEAGATLSYFNGSLAPPPDDALGAYSAAIFGNASPLANGMLAPQFNALGSVGPRMVFAEAEMTITTEAAGPTGFSGYRALGIYPTSISGSPELSFWVFKDSFSPSNLRFDFVYPTTESNSTMPGLYRFTRSAASVLNRPIRVRIEAIPSTFVNAQDPYLNFDGIVRFYFDGALVFQDTRAQVFFDRFGTHPHNVGGVGVHSMVGPYRTLMLGHCPAQ